MMVHIFNLVVGTLLLLISLISCVVLLYYHRHAKLNEFTLITISDFISTAVTGIFFILNYSYTFKVSDICDINAVIIKFGMTMLPLLNGFLSTFALNYECSNYTKRTCLAKLQSKGKKSLSILPQWLISIASFLYVATLQPEQISLQLNKSFEQCTSSSIFSTLQTTQCQSNETINQSQSINKYTILADNFFNMLLSDSLKYNTTPQNTKNINIQNKTNEIVNNVYALMSTFQNRTERNDTQRSEIISAQPIPYSQNITEYINFLTTALKIVHQKPLKQQTIQNFTYYNTNTTIETNENSIYQLDEMMIHSDNNSTTIENDAYENNNNIRNNSISRPPIEATNNIQIKNDQNQILYNNHDSQNKLSNFFKFTNQMFNVNTSVLTDTAQMINNTNCLMQCSVSNNSLKRHLFLLLFITYFIPICLTIFVYKNMNWTVKEVEEQDNIKSKKSTKIMMKSRQMTVASFLLLSPSFLDILLQTLLCLQIPEWTSDLFLLIIQVRLII